MDAIHTESVCVNQVMMTHWCSIYLRKQRENHRNPTQSLGCFEHQPTSNHVFD